MERVLSLQKLSEYSEEAMNELWSTFSGGCSDGTTACSTQSNGCSPGTREW